MVIVTALISGCQKILHDILMYPTFAFPSLSIIFLLSSTNLFAVSMWK